MLKQISIQLTLNLQNKKVHGVKSIKFNPITPSFTNSNSKLLLLGPINVNNFALITAARN